MSDNRSVRMKKGNGGGGLLIVGFFILSVYNFLIAFENQNSGCDKQQNIIFYKFENLILKIFSRTRILAWPWRL